VPPATADLCDDHPDEVTVVESALADFGGLAAFWGTVSTVSVYEDNALVRSALERPGDGRVLVVDGGGSRRRALVGDRLAALAAANGWSGIVLYGSVRDTAALREIPLGIKALGAVPMKSAKLGMGDTDGPVTFGAVTVRPGDWVCADADGVVVARRPLA
jgi:regulator of ribonuclease activity A